MSRKQWPQPRQERLLQPRDTAPLLEPRRSWRWPARWHLRGCLDRLANLRAIAIERETRAPFLLCPAPNGAEIGAERAADRGGGGKPVCAECGCIASGQCTVWPA